MNLECSHIYYKGRDDRKCSHDLDIHESVDRECSLMYYSVQKREEKLHTCTQSSGTTNSEIFIGKI